MTIKTEHGEFECRDLTFKDRRVSALGHLSDVQIDNVLTEIYSAYKQPPKKKK
jgi:hypothetical protein